MTSVHIGREAWVGIAFETSAGEGGTDPIKTIPYTANTLHNVVETIDDEAAKGVRERSWGSVAARTRGEGDITINVDVEDLPYLLIPALGTCMTQDLGGDVYTHVLTRKDSNPPTTICLTVNDTIGTQYYPYGVVNTLELTFSDGLVEATAGILSKAPVDSEETMDIVTEERILAFKDADIYFGSTMAEAENKAATETGAIGLTAFTLTINNNAEAQYESGSSSPAQISLGQFEVGGNYTLFYEDTTERDALEAQTARAMVAVFKGDTINSHTEKIQITIPQFHLTDRGIDTAPAGFVTENPTWVGDYDATNKSIIIKITNETSTTDYTCCVVSSSSSSSSSSSFSSSSSSSSSSSFSSSSSSFSSSSSSSSSFSSSSSSEAG